MAEQNLAGTTEALHAVVVRVHVRALLCVSTGGAGKTPCPPAAMSSWQA